MAIAGNSRQRVQRYRMTRSAPSIFTERTEMEQDAAQTVTIQVPAGSSFQIIFPHRSVMVVPPERKSDNGL
jgi:hypothetical protein